MAIRTSYFVSANSFVGRLDPRVKLLYILWVFVMIMVFSDPRYQAVIIATLAGAIVLGHLSFRAVFRAGRIGLLVGAVSWVLWIVFLGRRGQVLAQVLIWPITDAGVVTGLSVAIRVVSVLFAFLVVAMTTPTRDITVALFRLRVSIPFAMAIGIILRLIPQLQAEHGTIIEAQKSRATEFDKGGLLARFRKHSAYVIPLALRALKIVSDLSTAMDSRAFDPYGKRTFSRDLAYTTADRIMLVAMAFGLVASIALRLAGYGGLNMGSGGLGQ